MQKTEINWTELTWGAVSGCTKMSAGCAYCYAERICEPKRGSRAFPRGFDITLRPHKLGEPAKIKKPSLIFCNSTSDWFHEGIPDSYRDQMFEAIRSTPRHRYQVLTKRPANAARYFTSRTIPQQVWLGVTIENQRALDRLPILQTIGARVRFLSVEPLLGPLDLRGHLSGMHWVIVGGESGAHLVKPEICSVRGLVRRGNRDEQTWMPREDRADWIRNIRDACQSASVPFWFKQWGGTRGPLAGRELDGMTHDGMPSWAMPDGYQHRDRQLSLVGAA